MQRRVQKTHGDRQTIHGREDALEVLSLHGLELDQGLLQGVVAFREDHLPHYLEPLALHEHVLRAAQPDALGPEFPGPPGVLRGVGVRPHAKGARLVGPAEQDLEVFARRGFDQRHIAPDDPAVRSVYGEDFAGLEPLAANLQFAPRKIYLQGAAPGHGGLAHPTGDDRRVARHTPERGQHPLSRDHALDVVRVGLPAHQEHGLPGLRPLLGLWCVENYLPRGGPGRGGEAPCEDLQLGLRVHAGMEELVE